MTSGTIVPDSTSATWMPVRRGRNGLLRLADLTLVDVFRQLARSGTKEPGSGWGIGRSRGTSASSAGRPW